MSPQQLDHYINAIWIAGTRYGAKFPQKITSLSADELIALRDEASDQIHAGLGIPKRVSLLRLFKREAAG
jgi:hypothetical protein